MTDIFTINTSRPARSSPPALEGHLMSGRFEMSVDNADDTAGW
jgi:hypothetical protein